VFWLATAGIVVLSSVVAMFWLAGLAITLLTIPFIYIAIVPLTTHRLDRVG
jgi:hypothetical protein